jgi:preprotein translocase subunit YajC
MKQHVVITIIAAVLVVAVIVYTMRIRQSSKKETLLDEQLANLITGNKSRR